MAINVTDSLIRASFRLSSGAFLLPFGKFADMFGRRTMFISSMVGFTLAMLVIGFATSALYFDILSGVIGIFCAASVPPAVGLLGSAYEKPSPRKNKAFACFSAGTYSRSQSLVDPHAEFSVTTY